MRKPGVGKKRKEVGGMRKQNKGKKQRNVGGMMSRGDGRRNTIGESLFEAQLSMEEVPVEEWKSVLIGQLDATHRLRVAGLVADATSTYDDLVGALRVSGGDTGLSAAQRYFRGRSERVKCSEPVVQENSGRI